MGSAKPKFFKTDFMKIKFRQPRLNHDLHEKLIDSGWSVLREPISLPSAIFASFPLMALNLLISSAVIGIFSQVTLAEFGFKQDTFSITINLTIILGVIFLVIIHEFLHLIFIPNLGRSSSTIFGLTLLGGFVATEEEMRKSRFMLITIAPFIIGSVILPLFLGFLGWLNPQVKLLILLNAMASSVDMLHAILVFIQVPSDVILMNNGPRTYWIRDGRK
jgi:hypothetical protein